MLRVWLDCDPGHDDAIALLLACAHPCYVPQGVSTVFGNASLDNTTNNAMTLLTALHHSQVPVFPGAEKPLTGVLHVASSIHGQSGLDGTSLLPQPLGAKQPDHTAVAAIAEAIENYPDELSIVATGPLTNIALLAINYPDIVGHIRYLSVMGGGVGVGNWTKHAEFNIWSDPKAADIVFNCPGLDGKIVLVPINLTHRMIATEDVLQLVKRGPNLDKYTVFRQMLYELLTYFADTYKKEFGFLEGPPVHDPLAMAVLLPLYVADGLLHQHDVPNLDLDGRFYKISVDMKGGSVGRLNPEPCAIGKGVFIAENADPTAFWQLVYDAIVNLERATG